MEARDDENLMTTVTEQFFGFGEDQEQAWILGCQDLTTSHVHRVTEVVANESKL